MPAIETVSGKFVDPENPNPEDLLIEDMAWALSRTSRFAGHTITVVPYNNAQHSVFVSEMLENAGYSPKICLFGLLHDCAEAYIGDLPSPIKRIDGLNQYFTKIENNLLSLICDKFVNDNPSIEEWEAVKRFDRRACQIEAYSFMVSRGLVNIWGDRQQIDLLELQSFAPPESSIMSFKRFMERFQQLKEMM